MIRSPLAYLPFRSSRALIANMMVGVTTGYQKKMEIYGTGYSVKEQGGKLVLTVGFAHTAELPVPKGVKVTIDVAATRGNEVPAKFTLSGMVTDEEQQPLQGANLVIQVLKRGAASSADGTFIFENIPPGNHTLSVTYVGYESFSRSISVLVFSR